MYNDPNSIAPCHHLAGPSSGAGVKPGNQALAVSVTIPCQCSTTHGAEESTGKQSVHQDIVCLACENTLPCRSSAQITALQVPMVAFHACTTPGVDRAVQMQRAMQHDLANA